MSEIKNPEREIKPAIVFSEKDFADSGDELDSLGTFGGERGQEKDNSLEIKTDFDIERIKPLLKTEPDTAYFWSGRTDGVGGQNTAAEIAKEHGGVTLESIIEDKDIQIPKWDFDDPSSIEAWELASEAYASQVSGEIHAVIGSNLREGNIWENTELPRLKENPNVDKITVIDPKTQNTTIIFERSKLSNEDYGN